MLFDTNPAGLVHVAANAPKGNTLSRLYFGVLAILPPDTWATKHLSNGHDRPLLTLALARMITLVIITPTNNTQLN